ncbi:MAG TPA: hypothetical protein VJ696_00010 [Rhodanobacteraceae bacterium]|nr:hypothetical protein [Rhodanobacteraceae bacterium]
MARRILSICLLPFLLALSTTASALDESLSFRRTADHGLEAVIDGISDGPGCQQEYLSPTSLIIDETTIAISSPADETGCFLPLTPHPYRMIEPLGSLAGDRYDVIWTQPGLPDLTGVLVSDDIGNLVSNPDFDDGLDGWSLVTGPLNGGTMTLDDSIGAPDAPSLHIVGDQMSVEVAAQSSCIAIDDSAHVDLRVLVKETSGIIHALVQPYSDAECTTPLDMMQADGPGIGSWGAITLGDAALPTGTQSARVIVSADYGSMGTIGDTHFDHVAFGRTGTLPDGIETATEGLTGTWYDPTTSGQGFEFAMQRDAGGGGALFGAWYTYNLRGGDSEQRWYSLQAGLPIGTTTADFTIFRNVAGNFAAPPATTAVPVGTGSVTFSSCTSGLLTYAFDDGSVGGLIPIHRLMQDVDCEDGSAPSPPSDFGYSGTWYDPATSGQGFMVEINPGNAQAFFGWYTYAINGSADVEASQRWFSAQAPYTVGSTTMDLVIYASTGGSFGFPGGVETTPVGTATLTFTSCTAATLDYAFTSGEMSGKTGTIALTRLGAPPASCPTNS